MNYFAVAYYVVNLDPSLSIPIIYFSSLIIAVLLREFVQGWLRYALAILFLSTFAALWYELMKDYSPWQYIDPAVALVGGLSGLWNWLRRAVKDIEKL